MSKSMNLKTSALALGTVLAVSGLVALGSVPASAEQRNPAHQQQAQQERQVRPDAAKEQSARSNSSDVEADRAAARRAEREAADARFYQDLRERDQIGMD